MYGNTSDNWILITRTTEVRGINYDKLLNMATGAKIWIDTLKNQDPNDLNLRVWTEFPGMKEDPIFHGTEVECMRVIEKLAERFNASRIDPWEND